MKIKLIAISCFCLFNILTKAQNYGVSAIPDSLLKNADVVLRTEKLEIKISSASNASIKHIYALTILNEDGRDYADYMNVYDKFHKLNKVVAKLFDSKGTLLKTVKKRDMLDIAYDDRVSIISDARTVRFDFAWKAYPYTVEYEDEEDMKGFFSLPQWLPVQGSRFAIQNSSFTVKFPANYSLNYKLLTKTIAPIVQQYDDFKTYEWNINNYTAFEWETFSTKRIFTTPGVIIAPSDFEIDGFKGNLNSWKSFGQFNWKLFQGRDILPETIKADIHKLTDNIKDVDEKIKILYDYLQQNTHYISIQLGIGGWQPFDANYVAKYKYGDCKALSNYMVAILKEAGITAKHVIIKAGKGENGLLKDFPVNSFNHVVMFALNGNDTTWLECTSQFQSPGFMGSFTCDRDAMMIDSAGGHIVHTPIYNASDNIESRVIDAKIELDGTLSADINTTYKGISQEEKHYIINKATKDEKDKILNSELHLPTYHIDFAEFKEHKNKIPTIEEHLKITAPNYANYSAKRLFLIPNLINKEDRLDTAKKRKFDICIKESFTDIDSIQIKVPEGYTVESMPKDVSVENNFESYRFTTKFENNTIKVFRKHIEYAGTYPAEDYIKLAAIYNTMYQSDRSKMVLRKKDN